MEDIKSRPGIVKGFTSLFWLLILILVVILPYTDAGDLTLSFSKNAVRASLVDSTCLGAGGYCNAPLIPTTTYKSNYVQCGKYNITGFKYLAVAATSQVNCTSANFLTITHNSAYGSNNFVSVVVDLNGSYILSNNSAAIYYDRSPFSTPSDLLYVSFLTETGDVAYSIVNAYWIENYFGNAASHATGRFSSVKGARFNLVNMTPSEVLNSSHVRYLVFTSTLSTSGGKTYFIQNITIFNATRSSDNTLPLFNVSYPTPVCLAGNASQVSSLEIKASDADNDTILYSLDSFTDKLTSIGDYVQFKTASCKPDYSMFDNGKIQGNYTHNTGSPWDALQVFELTAKIDGDCIGSVDILTSAPPIILKPVANLHKNWTFQTSFFIPNDYYATLTQLTYIDALGNPQLTAVLNNTGANLSVDVNGVQLWNKPYKSSKSGYATDNDLMTLLISDDIVLVEHLITGINGNMSYATNWSLGHVMINSTPAVVWSGLSLKWATISFYAYLYEYSASELVPDYTTTKPTQMTVIPSNNYYRLYVTDIAHPQDNTNYVDIAIYGAQGQICTDGRYTPTNPPDTMEKRNSPAGFFYLISLMYGMAKNFPASPILASLAGLAGLIIFLMILFATEFAVFKSLLITGFYYFVMGFIGFFSIAYMITGAVIIALGISFKLISESSGGG